MPYKPARPCRKPGCPQLTTDGSGLCERHLSALRSQQDAERGTAAQRGYDARWRKARLAWLAAHPLCVMCQAEGRTTLASLVDHIRPHKSNQSLFWDVSNWQSLCDAHHRSKSIRDGALRG